MSVWFVATNQFSLVRELPDSGNPALSAGDQWTLKFSV
jgi:hypothetical protein